MALEPFQEPTNSLERVGVVYDAKLDELAEKPGVLEPVLERRDVLPSLSGEDPELRPDGVRDGRLDVLRENLPERRGDSRVMRNLVNVAARDGDELVHRASPRRRRGVDVAQIDGESIRVVLHDAAGEPAHERVDFERVVLADGGVGGGVGLFLSNLSIRRGLFRFIGTPLGTPTFLRREQHRRHGGPEVGQVLVEDLLLLVVP